MTLNVQRQKVLSHNTKGRRTMLLTEPAKNTSHSFFLNCFANRRLDSDQRDIVRRSSLRRIKCLESNLSPEGHYLNVEEEMWRFLETLLPVARTETAGILVGEYFLFGSLR
jgi:hypothetical protein